MTDQSSSETDLPKWEWAVRHQTGIISVYGSGHYSRSAAEHAVRQGRGELLRRPTVPETEWSAVVSR